MHLLFNTSILNRYDTQGMYKIYDRWPEIAKNAYNQNLESIEFSDIDHIVFAGMGGSGAIGDIFSSILSKENIHVCVTKGYLLPKTVDSNTLVVTTSISGNTIETLTVLDSAKKSKCKIITFTSGGKMEKYCNKNKIEYRKIPQMHSPRASFTGYLYSMLKVLDPILSLKKSDIDESITSLEKLKNLISSDNLNQNNPSLELAKWITDIPIIYYPAGLQAAAIRFKNSLQENSKMHAMTEDVIEACHNGIVSWEKPSNVQPILLRGTDDYIKTQERWKILQKYFNENKIDYRDIHSVNGNILTKLINMIYLLDYSTIYQATLSKTDPTPVNSIDFIKSKTKFSPPS
jgi:glucose/mannose-6-phosphate isomerase